MISYREILESVKLTFNDEMVGTGHGQNDLRLTAFLDGELVAFINYTTYKDEVAIKYLEVDDELRRKGIAKQLMLKLQKIYPKTEIDLGMLTDQGSKFIKSIKRFLFVDKAKHKKEADLRKELVTLQKREQKLIKQLKPGSKDNDRIGNELNDINDRVFDIEEELRDLII